MDMRESIPVVIGAILAMLLQIIIAPAIEIFSAMPNFITVYCLLVAVARPMSPVLPFVLGLINDVFVGTPIGSSSLALVVVCLVASRLFAALNNDTVLIPLVILVVASFIIELIMGFFALSFGAAGDAGGMLLYRALPCGLYDCVVCLILYPLAMRVLVPQAPMGPGNPAHL